MLGRTPLLGAVLTLALGVAGACAAPPALAAQTRQTRPSGPPIPSGAGAQITRELQSAWQITRGRGVIVAILDTGVASVSGLSGKIIAGPDYAPVANPVFTDGTVLASLIAGRGPSQGAAPASIGRAPDVRILSERIVAYGSGAKTALRYQLDGIWQAIEAKAIRYAVDHGAKVIICGESGMSSYTDLAAAVAYAISKKVVVITAGFALTRSSIPMYPDSLPGVINVSGTDVPGLPGPLRQVRFSSNYSVLVTTPANDLFGAGPGGHIYIGYGLYSAMAWATGTAALIKSAYPQLSPALVARALAVSANYHPPGGYNTKIGFGLINPIGALRAAGRLRALRLVAAAGQGIANPAAHFGSGPVPGVIAAAPLSPAALAGSSAAAVAGLGALALAFSMIFRGRRRSVTSDPARWRRRRWHPGSAAAGPSPEPTSAKADQTGAAQPVRNENGPAAPVPDQPAECSEPPP